MKRKRPARHDQPLKEQEKPSSTKSLRSNITGKLQTLLNGFVSELQCISEDKRQDVALLFNPEYKESNCNNVSSVVDSTFSNSADSTKVLQNFIDSAKSRISGLLSSKPVGPVSGKSNSLKNCPPSAQTKVKTLSIDPLEIQINLKFQSLLFKAFDTKKSNHVNKKQEATTSDNVITEKEWQDLSRLLQDFSESGKKKLHPSLTKEANNQFLTDSGSIQNPAVTHSTQPSLISQSKGHNKELPKLSACQGNNSLYPLAINSCKSTNKNAKVLKMDFFNESTDDSSSPRNPFDENCMLLLSDAERCPSYVDLHFSSESDIDQPKDVVEQQNIPVQPSESEDDEVVVLGEKSKTYQEVTLEEDDDGHVHEKVVEKVLEKNSRKEKEIKKPVFICPKCNKRFGAQSLLQFHIKMHTTETPSSEASGNPCVNSSSSSEDERLSNQRIRKENENSKINSKISSIKKNRRGKYKKRRSKEVSKSSL